MRREILIDSVPGEIRVAVLEDDLLAEVFVERVAAMGTAGNVYKGRVRKILPGMQSAFVDLGLERDAFLYVEDLAGGIEHLKRLEIGDLEPEAGEVPPERSAPAAIEQLVREGEEIVVQVTKDPIAEKGARITAHVTLPGRYLVFLPGVQHVGVSRRILETEERDRLKQLGQSLVEQFDLVGGLIVRTAGEGRASTEFEADARYLAGLWSGIQRQAAVGAAPSLLHREVGAVGKVLRDVFHHDVQAVVIEEEELLREAADIMERLQPDLVSRIHLHDDREPLFEVRGVVPQIEKALRPRVWLKSGGHIVINQTEALVAIDVNTGKYVGKSRLEDTILRINLEAVREIVRQIRLRDLSGIIVIDFIDMQEGASRQAVVEALQGELARDRSKSRVLQISEFGLVEITRQRTKASLERSLCRPCPSCFGSGRIKSSDTLYYEVVRECRKWRAAVGEGQVVLRLHAERVESFQGRRDGLAEALGGIEPGRIVIDADPTLLPNQWRLVPPWSGQGPAAAASRSQ